MLSDLEDVAEGLYLADTYDRRVQVDASRHRYKDAQSLQEAGRWNGAIYLAGYAIECSLKALICHEGNTNNLKETRMFKQGRQGAALHDLEKLREASAILDRAIKLDRTGKLKSAWAIIVNGWQKDELRYGRELGYKAECERFLKAVEELHSVILRRQGRGYNESVKSTTENRGAIKPVFRFTRRSNKSAGEERFIWLATFIRCDICL